MTTHPLWTDECWLPLMKLYTARPEGLKPVYSRGMVDLAVELHIPPQFLYKQMFRLSRPDTPWLRRDFCLRCAVRIKREYPDFAEIAGKITEEYGN